MHIIKRNSKTIILTLIPIFLSKAHFSMETENERYIKNKYPSNLTADANLDDLQAQAIRILHKDLDYEDFVSTIKAEEIRARASVKKHDYYGIDVFEAAGGYLAMYVRLLSQFQHLKSAVDKIGQKSSTVLSKLLQSPNFSEKALQVKAEISLEKLTQLIKEEENRAKKIQISYYFGGVNVYLSGCLLSLMKKDMESFATNLEGVLRYKKTIFDRSPDYYKELLYGVSGYIYCLLTLQTHFEGQNIEPEAVNKVKTAVVELVDLVIKDGIRSYGGQVDLNNLPKDFRLVYHFHEREYFGGAHGLFGVLYMLLRSYQLNHDAFTRENPAIGEKLIKTARASLEYLLAFQMKSGNFPSSAKGAGRDSLVQFCHGSPGAVHCLLIAAQVFKDEELGEKCQRAAIFAGENIWDFGLLRKGYGLCHGISGNGYNFLTLYRHTNDHKWLYRALRFINTKEDSYYKGEIAKYDLPDRYEVGISDYPYSMMLGLAGDICYQVETLIPEHARFPGYEV